MLRLRVRRGLIRTGLVSHDAVAVVDCGVPLNEPIHAHNMEARAMSLARLLAIVLLPGVLAGAAHATAAEVVLHGRDWSVALDPERLSAAGRPADGSATRLVWAPTPEALDVADLRHDDQHATWRLPALDVSVEMRMDGDVLAVEFRAAAAGEFAWPIVRPDPKIAAYVAADSTPI